MITRYPPKLATWLLTRFCYGSRKDSLIGDLHEQFAAGKTEAWYWRQSLLGLATSAVSFARAEGPAFIAALVTAWLVMATYFAVNLLYVQSIPVWGKVLRDHLDMRGFLLAIFVVDTSIRFAMFVFAGWIAARLQPRHRYAALALLIATAAIWRFVPQRIAPVFDPSTHVMLHMGSAVIGLVAGALLFGTLTKKNAVPR